MPQTCEDFGCDPEVFSCAVTIMDRYIALLPDGALVSEDLSLIGFAAVYLACKQSGKFIYAKTLSKFLKYRYSEDEIKVNILFYFLYYYWYFSIIYREI